MRVCWERARALSQAFSYAFQCISVGRVLRKSPGPFSPYFQSIEQWQCLCDSDKCLPGGCNLVRERARALSQAFSYAFQCISMGKVLRKSPGLFSLLFSLYIAVAECLRQ